MIKNMHYLNLRYNKKTTLQRAIKWIFLAFFIFILVTCVSSPQKDKDNAEHQKGIDYYSQIISINPENVEAYKKRAEYYCRLNLYQEALKDLNIAIRLSADNDMLFAMRSYVYSFLEHHQDALKDANKAIEINPKNMIAYYNRGVSYFFLGQNEEALADLNLCVEFEPNETINRFSRSKIYCDMKRYEEALEDLNYAIKIDPNLLVFYKRRGAVYKKLAENANDETMSEMYRQKSDTDFSIAESLNSEMR